MKKNLLIVVLFIFYAGILVGQPVYPGPQIGNPVIKLSQTHILVRNKVLSALWTIKDNTIKAKSFQNKETGEQIDWNNTPWFSIQLKDGKVLTSNDFKIVTTPQVKPSKASVPQ